MPDHVHLLVLPRRPATLLRVPAQAVKQHVAREAVRWLAVHNAAGLARMLDRQPSGDEAHRFWQRGPGHDRNVFEPEAIHAELNYIHNNPVRKGLVGAPEDWKWSSASAWRTRDPGTIPIAFASFPAWHRT